MVALHYGITDARLEGLKSPGLIKDFSKVMTKVSQWPMSTEGTLLLFSHEFVCLSVRGNKAIKQSLEVDDYVVGSYWTPEVLGLQGIHKLRLSNKLQLSVTSVPIADSESGVLGYISYIDDSKNALDSVQFILMMIAECLVEMSANRRQLKGINFNQQYIDASKACFLVLDDDGFVLHCSQAFLERFTVSEGDIINTSVFETFLFPPKVKSLIAEGGEINGDNVDFDFAGQLQQYRVTMLPIAGGCRVLRFSDASEATTRADKKHRLASTLERYHTESPAMQRVISAAKACMKNTSPIYILGEEGTGKRSLAHTMHNSCSRFSEGPFVAVNLHSAKREDLSELLLGSDEEGNKSKFELANGGTLYIERIDLLPGVLQAALTHIILTKTLFDFNTNKSTSLDFRLITSSINPLEDLVHERRFCPSLYYYLTGASLSLPNLQNRTEDISLIIDRKLSELYGDNSAVDDSLRHLLLEHAKRRVWAGNISELAKWIEHAFLHRDNVLLDAESVDAMSVVATPIQLLDDIEKREIANALALLNRKYVDVAEQLGISLSTLRRKIAKYDL
ncbi:sigma 54-interacting transcriptional regulator [Enterovibrio calviensis]|uniref:sigma 54-interacting transcriptional regulator n=1 Tax=Enterovibrio calviensis TaxID=91359 RepID=UPI0004871F24|nr:sigma 54-interacting transcriptional regulator [Enterovibrio calviensis]